MNRSVRFAALLVSLITSTQACPRTSIAADVDLGAQRESTGLNISGLSPEMDAMVVDAVDLFADSGLELPPLVVRGGESGVGCGGHDGIHRPLSGWSEIELCLGEPTGAVFHTILHELAHAWSTHDLSVDHQAEFQALRGFEFWRNYDSAAWEDNGTEQAAEIIAWGVNDRVAGTVRIDRVSCGDLHAGFVALTGLEPLNGLTDICAGDAVLRS